MIPLIQCRARLNLNGVNHRCEKPIWHTDQHSVRLPGPVETWPNEKYEGAAPIRNVR